VVGRGTGGMVTQAIGMSIEAMGINIMGIDIIGIEGRGSSSARAWWSLSGRTGSRMATPPW